MALHLYTIPAIRSFADALAGGLIDQYGDDPLGLARGLVLLPNNRARRAVTDAFVRASGGGLLLPRLVAIGDVEAAEGVGALLDPAGAEPVPVPPAVAPLHRRMVLARLVGEERRRAGAPADAVEAVRLAGDLARTLDQLLVEEIAPNRLRDLELSPELSAHWQRNLTLFELLLDRWPDELARIGCIDLATRRATLLDRIAARWRGEPPAGFVCAAGITDAAPAVARLLRCVAGLARGSVVIAGLGIDLDQEEWDAIGPFVPDPVTGRAPRPSETHPQYHLKRLLDRMGVARGEFSVWRDRTGPRSTPARAKAIASAFAPAELTGRWTDLPAEQRRLSGVALAEFATAADEAQGIALALRETLETPERTAALVTPDRALARRVAAHCRRWGIDIDDTAGRPLSILPPGTLLTAIAEAAAQRFAPLALLALVKHPLVRAGDRRLRWLDGARALDRALRGPRPAAGLGGIDAHLADRSGRDRQVRAAAAAWWPEARVLLEPVAEHFDDRPRPLAALAACLREAAQELAGDEAWTGPAGRAAAELLADLEAQPDGPAEVDPANLAQLLVTLMDEVAVRPPQGGHPRLAIYGLIEGRLQSAELMILAGLNEGIWPGGGPPDPWLAPRLRADLGLAGLDARVGVAAHDLAQGLGAPAVLVTRSRRDARSPALASRFWLRLEALAGDRFDRADDLVGWVQALDDAGEPEPAARPAPMPPRSLRPKVIAVTEVDRLKADPYAFYARRILRLSPLDAVDADPSAAWRGTAVHDVLQRWAQEDGCALDKLRPRATAMIADERTHPLLRALWWPRLAEAIDWTAAEMARLQGEGRDVLAVEGSGEAELAGVSLTGRFDRIDRLPGGGLGIVDYKTGKPPSARAVAEGFSLQLGLLGHIASAGGFATVDGDPSAFEYWSLARNRQGGFGYRESPCDPDGKRDKVVTSEFVALARRSFADAAGRWLTGEEAFVAKLHPDHAPYADYDQLMRQDEWYGRE